MEERAKLKRERSQKFVEYNTRLEQAVTYSGHIYKLLNFIHEAERLNFQYRAEVIILLHWYREQKALRYQLRAKADSEIIKLDSILYPDSLLSESEEETEEETGNN